MTTSRSDQELTEKQLLQRMAAVIADLGVDRVLTRPVVLPTERFFPDPFDGSLLAVGRLLRRLMRFAGIDDVVEVIVSTDELVTERSHWAWMSKSTQLEGAPIALSGCTSHQPPRLVFSVDAARLGDADGLVGAGAREVARAVRLLAGAGADAGGGDDVDVDLSAICLGFGVFITNDTHRLRSAGRMEGGMWLSENSSSRSGALSPQTASTAFAALLVARGLPLGPIIEHLEVNQAHFTKRAAADLEDAPVVHRLGLPQGASFQAAIDLDALLAPGRDDAIHIEGEVEAAPSVGVNHGRPVFRLKRDAMGVGAFGGLVVGGVGGVAIAVATAGPNAVVAALAFVGVAVGAALGKRRRFAVCADTSCNAVIPTGAKTCPGCDGIVAGTIRHAAERLDAAERWQHEQGGA